MVCSKIRLNPRLERNRMVRARKPKINIEALMNKAEEFQLRLENPFESMETEGEVEEMAGNIISDIQKCAMETAGKEISRRKEKLKPKTKRPSKVKEGNNRKRPVCKGEDRVQQTL
jgi:hypothetical protein